MRPDSFVYPSGRISCFASVRPKALSYRHCFKKSKKQHYYLDCAFAPPVGVKVSFFDTTDDETDYETDDD